MLLLRNIDLHSQAQLHAVPNTTINSFITLLNHTNSFIKKKSLQPFFSTHFYSLNLTISSLKLTYFSEYMKLNIWWLPNKETIRVCELLKREIWFYIWRPNLNITQLPQLLVLKKGNYILFICLLMQTKTKLLRLRVPNGTLRWWIFFQFWKNKLYMI